MRIKRGPGRPGPRRFHADPPCSKGIHGAFPNGELVIFRLAHDEAHFWTMGMDLREAEIERVEF